MIASVIPAQVVVPDYAGGKRLATDERLTARLHARMVAVPTDTAIDSASTAQKIESGARSTQSQRKSS